jgi:hypothetical protein
MSLTELKEKLINSINTIEDDHLLYEMYRLLEPDQADPEVYKLSGPQRNAVAKGMEQINSGKFIENREADDMIELLLEKGQLILKPKPAARKGWEKAFKRMHEAKDDKPLM